MKTEYIRPTSAGIFPRIPRGAVHDVALGNGTAFRIAVIQDDGWGNLFVAVENRGAYGFNLRPDPGYLMGKLNVRNEADAANLTDFISDQMLVPGDDPAPRRGRYN